VRDIARFLHLTRCAAWRKVKSFKGVDSARVRYLTVAQARRLVNVTDPEFRPLVQAALQTGCRYSELARLEVADFNPDSGTLAIRRSKSGKTRHVVLTDEGLSFFRQLTAGRAGSETMLRKANGEAWRASHQLRPMDQACQHAKIDPPVSFHALQPRSDERRAAAGGGEEPGSRRHAHGRKALRALGA
jgi:integrase